MDMVFKNTLLVLFVTASLLTGCSDPADRKAQYFQKGMELYEAGDYVKARLEFKNVAQIDPKHAEAHFMFGQIEEKEQNWRKAFALFLRVVELDPAHTEAQIHLGRLYALSGNIEKAMESAETVLKANPKSPAGLVLKALAQARMGEKEAAIQEAVSALEVEPTNIDAISLLSSLYADLAEMGKAIDYAKKGLKQNPGNIGLYLLLARHYEKTGATEEVAKLLRKMIELQPENLASRARLAGYMVSKKRLPEAEAVLKSAITALPESSDAKLALVDYYLKQISREKAVSALKKFIADNPTTNELQFGLAQLYLSNKQVDDAILIFQAIADREGLNVNGAKAKTKLASLWLLSKKTAEASKLIEDVLVEDPKNTDALLVRAALALANKDPDGGMADIRTLLGEDPGHLKALRLKAKAHLAKREIPLARESLEKAIQAHPQEAAANFELAQILAGTGELDDAIAVLEKMLQFTPDHLGVLQSITKIHMKQAKWDSVLTDSQRLIEKHKKNPLGYHYRGLALQGQGKLELSVDAFERALLLKPNAVEPLIGLAKSRVLQKMPDKALKRVRQVIDQKPDHFLAQNLEGEILMSQQQIEMADISFEKAIKINPKWSTPYRNRAKIRAAQKNADALMGMLKTGYTETKDVNLGVDLAVLLDRTGNSPEAIQLYDDLLQKQPNMAVAANNLAMILVRNNPDQHALDRALELTKGFAISKAPIFLDTLGWIHYKRGEFEQAVPILERANRANNKLAELDYHLGMAYYKAGRNSKARDMLAKSVKTEVPFEGLDEAKAVLSELEKPSKKSE